MPTARQHRRVRQSYDAVAEEYAVRIGGELAGKPLDRGLLGALIEQTADGAPLADLGCGPGHVAAWMAGHGVPCTGIDLSPEMIAIGRREYPQVEFRVGDLLSLPAADAEFGSAVALYSLIHLEPAELPAALGEIRRVLRPDGLLLVAFHIGTEVRHTAQWWGHEVDVDFHFMEPDAIAELLEDAGFAVQARLERTSYPAEAQTRRGYLLARRA
jgi:ubiquinone/menaquinone biosynthesis C-methylase UbiE